jgi:hypothetical protein
MKRSTRGFGGRRVPRAVSAMALLGAGVVGAVSLRATAEEGAGGQEAHEHAIEITRPERLSPSFLAAQGDGWKVESFRSDRGFCSELSLGGAVSQACGYDTEKPARGKTEPAKISYDVAGRPGEGALVFGPVSDDVESVIIELRNGRTHDTRPQAAGAPGFPRFYGMRLDISRGHDVAAVSAVAADGKVLERREIADRPTR